jgi:phage gp36-like protein
MTELGLPGKAISSMPSWTVDRALAARSIWLDGYLGARYPVPLTAWSDDVRSCVCAMTAFDLLTTLGFNPEDPGDQAVLSRCKMWERWALNVAEGIVMPAGLTGTSAASTIGPTDAQSDEPRGY